jgi:hypothetical protein
MKSRLTTRELAEAFVKEHHEQPDGLKPPRNKNLSEPEEALRAAILRIRQKYQADPASWAAFTVYGLPARRGLYDR